MYKLKACAAGTKVIELASDPCRHDQELVGDTSGLMKLDTLPVITTSNLRVCGTTEDEKAINSTYM